MAKYVLEVIRPQTYRSQDYLRKRLPVIGKGTFWIIQKEEMLKGNKISVEQNHPQVTVLSIMLLQELHHLGVKDMPGMKFTQPYFQGKIDTCYCSGEYVLRQLQKKLTVKGMPVEGIFLSYPALVILFSQLSSFNDLIHV